MNNIKDIKNTNELYQKKVKIIKAYYMNKIHLGHSFNQLNPKMNAYLYRDKKSGKRVKVKLFNKQHTVIDIKITNTLLNRARRFVRSLALQNKTFLFVGTRFHLKHIVSKQAKECNQYYINYKWAGGLLTNWKTFSSRIQKLKFLESQEEKGILLQLPAKEYSQKIRELNHLRKHLNGIKDMKSIPDVIISTHQHADLIAIAECNKLGIPVIGITDTNCNPDIIDFVVPSNDDSTISVDFILNKIVKSILQGQKKRKKKLN